MKDIYENLKFNKNPNQIYITYLGGPKVEILGNQESKYKINFINKDTNQILHSDYITNNMWTKCNIEYFVNWEIKIWENDILIKTEHFSLINKKVRISIDSKSLGDNIAWIPYVEEFRKKYKCIIYVSTFWNKLFKKSYPLLNFIEPSINNSEDISVSYKLGWFYNKHKEPQLPNTIPLQQSSSNILGLPFTEIKTKIDFTPKSRPYGSKYIVIAPHSTAGLKYWNNINGWQETVDFLISKGYKVINISLENCNIRGVDELNDKSIENTLNVIYYSKFLIGLSSGLSWLSWALNKQIVMISNFTEENHEFTNNCVRITNKKVCNSCWNNPNFKFDKGDWNWCPINKNTNKHFECHTSITGEMVINKIKDLI